MSFRTASLLFLLLVYGPLFAQTGKEPTFKGDHLGATVAEFVRRPAVAAMISKCKEVAPKLLTDAEVLKKYGKQVFSQIQASELRAQANGTHAVEYYDTDLDAYLDRCGARRG